MTVAILIFDNTNTKHNPGTPCRFRYILNAALSREISRAQKLLGLPNKVAFHDGGVLLLTSMNLRLKPVHCTRTHNLHQT